MCVCLEQFNACTKSYLKFQSEQWQQRGHTWAKHSQRLVTTYTALAQAGKAFSSLEMTRWFHSHIPLWCCFGQMGPKGLVGLCGDSTCVCGNGIHIKQSRVCSLAGRLQSRGRCDSGVATFRWANCLLMVVNEGFFLSVSLEMIGTGCSHREAAELDWHLAQGSEFPDSADSRRWNTGSIEGRRLQPEF